MFFFSITTLRLIYYACCTVFVNNKYPTKCFSNLFGRTWNRKSFSPTISAAQANTLYKRNSKRHAQKSKYILIQSYTKTQIHTKLESSLTPYIWMELRHKLQTHVIHPQCELTSVFSSYRIGKTFSCTRCNYVGHPVCELTRVVSNYTIRRTVSRNCHSYTVSVRCESTYAFSNRQIGQNISCKPRSHTVFLRCESTCGLLGYQVEQMFSHRIRNCAICLRSVATNVRLMNVNGKKFSRRFCNHAIFLQHVLADGFLTCSD